MLRLFAAVLGMALLSLACASCGREPQAAQRSHPPSAVLRANADAIARLSLFELRPGEIQSPEDRLRGLLLKFPKRFDAALLLANAKVQSRDFPAAEIALKSVLEKDPKSVQALAALAQIHIVLGDAPKAIAELAAALSVEPKNGAILDDLAHLRLRQGQTAEAGAAFKRLADSGLAEYSGAYGLFLFSQNRREEGTKEFERVYRAEPENRANRSHLIDAYLAAGRIPDAQRILTVVLKKNEKDSEALIRRAEILLAAGDYAAAENDVNRASAFRSDWAEADYVLSRIHQAQGATKNQRRELNEAIRVDPALLPARIDLAQCLIAIDDPKAALELLDLAPGWQRHMEALVVQRNWALLALNRMGEVSAAIQEAGAPSPGLQLQDALVKLKKKDEAGARAELRGILAHNPEDLRALDILARSYSEANQAAAATAVVQEYAGKRPQSAPLRLFLGSWLFRSGDRVQAAKAFEAAKLDDATSAAAEFALAEIDLTGKNPSRARSRLQALLAVDRSNIDARVLLGMVEESEGRYEAAMEAYRMVLDQQANNLYALNNLAYRLISAGKTNEALELAQRAFELNPKSGAVEDTLGWALYAKGIYKIALPHLQNAAGQEALPIRMYHLASAYLKLGDRAQALEAYREAVKADPGLPEAKTVEALLRSSASAPSGR